MPKTDGAAMVLVAAVVTAVQDAELAGEQDAGSLAAQGDGWAVQSARWWAS